MKKLFPVSAADVKWRAVWDAERRAYLLEQRAIDRHWRRGFFAWLEDREAAERLEAEDLSETQQYLNLWLNANR